MRLTTCDAGDLSSLREVGIWDNSGCVLLQRCALHTPLLHGKVCVDKSWFGVLLWSLEETTLVYAAKEQQPETTTNNDVAKRRGCFALHEGVVEDYGEKYDGKSTLGLFLMNVDTRLDGWKMFSSTKHVFLGQPVFTPSGKGLVYVGWNT